jgi:hypothetical protein
MQAEYLYEETIVLRGFHSYSEHLYSGVFFRSVVVGYGIFKRTTFWENIERCYLDEVSSIRYGGWGIRIGRVKGRWRLVYNVIRGPRVVLSLKKGWFREFVFSTKNPEEVMKIVGQRIGRISQA